MIDFDSAQLYHEIAELQRDCELKTAVWRCIEAQKKLGAEKHQRYFQPNPNALAEVSEDALQRILADGNDVSDIRTNTDITNCIVFHTKNLDGSFIDQKILSLRKEADAIVVDRTKSLFTANVELSVQCSGHFWYPPGGYMGWHTNQRKPGWRLYVNYAEQPDESFFRYRDPDTAAIHTAIDNEWNFRLFKICREKPFWHAVYSNVDRYSLGYIITKPGST